MSDDFRMTISIPADDDGYVLLKCPNCGTYFKVMPADIEDDGILEIFCPSCGLVGNDYITDDVLELALAMTENKMKDMIDPYPPESFPECLRGFCPYPTGLSHKEWCSDAVPI